MAIAAFSDELTHHMCPSFSSTRVRAFGSLLASKVAFPAELVRSFVQG